MLDTIFGTLTRTTCCSCGVAFGLDNQFYAERLADKKFFHCPNGHSQRFTGPTEAQEQKARADRLAQELIEETKRRREAERSKSALRGINTRVKNRISKGVCPCCNRYFANLHRHMSGQHPTYRETGSPDQP